MKTAQSLALLLLCAVVAQPQSRSSDLSVILGATLQTPDVVTFQLRQYLYRSIPKLSPPSSAQRWTAETERLRKHLLESSSMDGPRNGSIPRLSLKISASSKPARDI